MPNLKRILLIGSLVALAGYSYFEQKPSEIDQKTVDFPVLSAEKTVVTKDLASVSSLANNKENIEFIYVIDANKASPIYVLKAKNSDQVSVLQVPSWTHNNLEARVLMPNAVSYQLADEKFVQANKAVLDALVELPRPSIFARIASGIVGNLGLILMGVLIYFFLKTMPRGAGASNIVKPEDIPGSLDDLVGLEDIKAEVAHLKSMIENKVAYEAHGIAKPFNVMLSGPAGTGKTKLAGFVAKDLGVPIIYASGSNLETGFVGGGSAALKKIQAQAQKLGDCVIFLDEAQTLLMERGQSGQKWADDTPNTLLTILDGIQVQKKAFLKRGAKPSKGVGIVWVVASNFDENKMAMDEAVLRRFPVKIAFRLPSHKERREILDRLLKAKAEGCVAWPSLDLDRIAGVMEGLSPAVITTVVDTASRLSIEDKAPIDTSMLLKAFERVTVGLTDRETTAGKEKDRERVAIHELGHFIAHVAADLRAGVPVAEIKKKSTFLKVSTESIAQQGALGYMLSTRPESSLQSVSDLEQQVVELYGGMAAEEVFYGQAGVSLGAANDIQKATKILRAMIEQVSVYGRSKLDYSAFMDLPKDVVGRIEEKSAELYEEAVKSVEENREFIEKVRRILLEKFIIEKDEVFEILEGFVASKHKETKDATAN